MFFAYRIINNLANNSEKTLAYQHILVLLFLSSVCLATSCFKLRHVSTVYRTVVCSGNAIRSKSFTEQFKWISQRFVGGIFPLKSSLFPSPSLQLTAFQNQDIP
jgi:hypothetical protein